MTNSEKLLMLQYIYIYIKKHDELYKSRTKKEIFS